MIRYTTATQTITIQGVNLSNQTVYVTYKSEFLGEAVNADSVTVSYDSATSTTTIVSTLTQTQTAKLRRGKCFVQVNWVSGGVRHATKVQEFTIGDNLLEAVI